MSLNTKSVRGASAAVVSRPANPRRPLQTPAQEILSFRGTEQHQSISCRVITPSTKRTCRDSHLRIPCSMQSFPVIKPGRNRAFSEREASRPVSRRAWAAGSCPWKAAGPAAETTVGRRTGSSGRPRSWQGSRRTRTISSLPSYS